MSTVEKLYDKLDLMEAGVYNIHTSSGSVYQIVADPDGINTLTREPSNAETNSMRHDGEPSVIFSVLHCEVGDAAAFNLFGITDEPEKFTQRVTTRVQKIVKME